MTLATQTALLSKNRVSGVISKSNLISRDLSWLQFNYRVLDQVRHDKKPLLDRLRFLSIASSNLDEFLMIRVGSLYNYLDYGKERIDYSGLRERPFKKRLLSEIQEFSKEQNNLFKGLETEFMSTGFRIAKLEDLTAKEVQETENYFTKTVYPMLTPMAYDQYHAFPLLNNKTLIFGVITRDEEVKSRKKISFVQIPHNIPRFYEIEKDGIITFVPIEEIIRANIEGLYKNVKIISTSLFRITRNGDFTLDDNDDIEEAFVEELKRKLKTRRTGRVVRVEVETGYSEWLMKQLQARWNIENDNIFETDTLIDFTAFWQIVNHEDLKEQSSQRPLPKKALKYGNSSNADIFEYLKTHELLLHHPYNSMEPVLDLLEKSAEDPNVLAIKMTIYRVAGDSQITNALLKAAENGKHVSVLFEVKARFDEENNLQEAERLQKAGCYVIYGVGSVKTHTKLLLIVRKEQKNKIRRYVHMSSGNYNENTARLYTDVGLLSTDEQYAEDISDFFNVITGHSAPTSYRKLITAPGDMRKRIIALIDGEIANAKEGKTSGIVLKVNSLEDREVIEKMYAASNAGVQIKLIVRGICCLRPGRKGLSENIYVKSIVGDFLEHSRLYYFHNDGDPLVYGGSADIMVRSYDRRIESLFLIASAFVKQQAIHILNYNLRDNVNSYVLTETGEYQKEDANGSKPFDVHKEFFKVSEETVKNTKLLF